jgi:hypothetical protein
MANWLILYCPFIVIFYIFAALGAGLQGKYFDLWQSLDTSLQVHLSYRQNVRSMERFGYCSRNKLFSKKILTTMFIIIY